MKKERMRLLVLVVLIAAVSAAPVLGDEVGTATIDVNIAINAIAAITVTGSDVSFTVGSVAPTAGDLPDVDDTGNVPTYLQYSSIVPNGETRTIAVQTDAAPPAGLVLNIRAGTPSGHGGVGTAVAGGVSFGSTYVGGTDQTIITGITSCATGTGVSQGPPIFYSLAIDEATFESLDSGAGTTITVIYTLVGS